MNEIVKVEAPKEIAIEQVNAVKEAFKPTFEAMAELEPRYKALTDIKLVEPTKEQCKEARAVRLLLVKTRTGTATTHKVLKADAIVYGRYLDGMKKAQLVACEQRESDLLEIEKHFENIERERIAALTHDRQVMLSTYDVPVEAMPANLGKMETDVWEAYYDGVYNEYNRRKEAEKKAEEERVAKEKAEAEERKRIRLENEKLKAEAEAERKKRVIELEENNRLEAERVAKDNAERRAIEDKARKEREEAEVKLKAERDEREKLERENVQREQKEKELEFKEQQEKAQEAKRVADQSHRDKIEAGIALALMGQGIIDSGGGGEKANKIVEAIKSGAIPSLTIEY